VANEPVTKQRQPYIGTEEERKRRVGLVWGSYYQGSEDFEGSRKKGGKGKKKRGEEGVLGKKIPQKRKGMRKREDRQTKKLIGGRTPYIRGTQHTHTNKKETKKRTKRKNNTHNKHHPTRKTRQNTKPQVRRNKRSHTQSPTKKTQRKERRDKQPKRMGGDTPHQGVRGATPCREESIGSTSSTRNKNI